MNDASWPPEGVAMRAPPRAVAMPVVWRGRGSVVLLLLKNLALTIVTLGFYRFWARTRLRRYLWSNVEVLGDPLAYTGTGMELFKGFLIALVVLVPLGAVSVALNFVVRDPIAQVAAQIVYGLLIAFLIFFAIFSARRYRLTRTVWRGVRFGLDGKAADYAWRKFLWIVLAVLSFGIAIPWLTVAEQRYLMTRTRFGDSNFAFTGRGGELFGSWLIVYVTLGLGYWWYLVRQFRYMVNNTQLGGAGFHSDVRFWPIFGRLAMFLAAMMGALFVLPLLVAIVVFAALQLTGMGDFAAIQAAFDENQAVVMELITIVPMVVAIFILVVSYVLVWPLLYIPVLRHVCTTTIITSPAALSTVVQSSRDVPATGEGLADAFDVGLA